VQRVHEIVSEFRKACAGDANECFSAAGVHIAAEAHDYTIVVKKQRRGPHRGVRQVICTLKRRSGTKVYATCCNSESEILSRLR
jgi:hypothetical protein